MRNFKSIVLTLCATLTLIGGRNAAADDTEIFLSGSSSTSSYIRPNILLILDTSGSMNKTVDTYEPYDSTKNYSDGDADCDSDYVYFWPAANGNAPKKCDASGLASFKRSDYLKCKAAVGGLDGSKGYYQDTFTRLKKNSNSNFSWQSTMVTGNSARDVECFADSVGTIYGNSMTTADNRYPKASTGTSQSDSWYTDTDTELENNWWKSNTGSTYYLFSPNYIRYNNDPPPTSIRYSRLDIVKTAVSNLLDTVPSVNVGLMRYDSQAHGGMVVKPIAELTGSYKTALLNAVKAFQPDGGTPLSETLYEAYLYLSGKDVVYGDTSKACTEISNASSDANGDCKSGKTVPFPSDATSLADSDTYDSPLDNATSCKSNNHIIYLTDGEPTSDDESDGDIKTLLGGTACTGTGDGRCLDDLSKYMHEHDLIGSNSKVTTNYIGFGADVVSTSAKDYLTAAATAGGGKFYPAGNITDLSDAFESIFNVAVSKSSATFVTPSVAVNSFNRTQVLEDLYIGLFKPSLNTRWDGNVKKFKLRDIDSTAAVKMAIVGQGATTTTVATTSAVDPTSGFFYDDAKDIWTLTAAGDDASHSDATKWNSTVRGGAAHKIPTYSTRKVYTYLGGSEKQLSLAANFFNTDHKTDLVTAGLGTTDVSTPTSEQLINWVRGQDIDDDDNDNSTTDDRHTMGDPIHSQPAVVIYGNASGSEVDKLNDAVVYVTSNDGMLHAYNVVSGIERWAFVPKDVINQMLPLYNNAETTIKKYTLDGDVRVLKYDQNGNGIVDDNVTVDGVLQHDRVVLYFSQGRGGPSYYAIDVTDKDNPKYLWSLNSSTADFGAIVSRSWSTPTLGRVNTGGTQNPQKLVLIFGGGYDAVEESESFNTSDSTGNAIFIVDAIKGSILWRAGGTSSGANLELAKMTHAIPSNVTVLDTNADGYSDRMYVGDMAGQLWRFDMTSYVDNPTPVADVSFSIAGGVIASLGGKETATVAENRVFYSAPDVSKIVTYGHPSYYNIAIGSGDRAKPKSNVTTQDRFYAIRDYHLGAMTQTVYNSFTIIKDADLTVATGTSTLPTGGIGTNGWKLPLSTSEKALAQSITLDGLVIFTTFIPGVANPLACVPTTGKGRTYTMDLATGTKYFTDPDTANTTDGDGLYEDNATTGLPSTASVFNSSKLIRTDGTPDTSTPGTAGTCVVGVNINGNCVDFGRRIKTFWKESGVD